MLGQADKKKIANTIYRQVYDKPVADVEYSPDIAVEAVAKDMIAAMKEGDVVVLAEALKSLFEIMEEKENYSEMSNSKMEY